MSGWANRVLLSYWGFVLAGLSYYLLIQLPFFNQLWDYSISLAMTVFIFHVAVLAYVQPHVFQANALPTLTEAVHPARLEGVGTAYAPSAAQVADSAPTTTVASAAAADPPPHPLHPTPRYGHSGLPPGMAATMAGRLETLMRTEQLYRQPDLRLETLAQRLDVSRHHLSQVLNEQMGCSFFEYVNRLRIAEARRLLHVSAAQALNVSEVAWEVGYNNRVSFNRAFKEATGVTPTEFRRNTNFE